MDLSLFFALARRLLNYQGTTIKAGVSIMETQKSADFVLSSASAERKALLSLATKPVSAPPMQHFELDKLLEEMAEIIEAEGGILTP